MLAVLKSKLKYTLINLPIIAVMTVMAVGLTYVFGVGFSQGYQPSVYIVDDINNIHSERLVEALAQYDNYQFIEMNYDEALNNLENKEGIAVVHLVSLDESLNIDFIKTQEGVDVMMVKNIVQSEMDGVLSKTGYTSGVAEMLTMYQLDVSEDSLYKDLVHYETNYESFIVDGSYYKTDANGGNDSLKHSYMGYLVFFSMFTVVFTVGSIVEEKESFIWHRQIVSPLKSWQIFGGNLLNGVIVGYGQVLLILFAGKYIMDIDLGGNFLALLLVLFAYVLAMNGLGLLFSGFVSSPQQLGAIAPVIIVSTSMLGGTMWPLEMITNKALLFAANLMPQKWAMDGMRSIIVYNGDFSNVMYPVSILLLIAVILFVLSLVPYNRVETK
jgi:ABC-2 type transport system permease protein